MTTMPMGIPMTLGGAFALFFSTLIALVLIRFVGNFIPAVKQVTGLN